ncbi:MAG: hypothetical protein WC782_01025 [Methylococcaceae bacterium]
MAAISGISSAPSPILTQLKPSATPAQASVPPTPPVKKDADGDNDGTSKVAASNGSIDTFA